MDGRLLCYAALFEAAVVYTLLNAVPLQRSVHCIRPGCPPLNELFIAVPPGGERILPPVSGALRMLVGTLIAMTLRLGWRQIDFLFPDLVLILLFPAVMSCCIEFGSGKTVFLSVSYT